MEQTEPQKEPSAYGTTALSLISVRDLKVHFDLSIRGLVARALGR